MTWPDVVEHVPLSKNFPEVSIQPLPEIQQALDEFIYDCK